MKKQFIAVVLSVLTVIGGGGLAFALGNSPLEDLKGNVFQVLNVLSSTRDLKTGQTEARYSKLRPIVQSAFDLKGISQQALGKDWNRLTADQQNEFINIFAELVGVSYLSHLDGDDVEFKVDFIDYRFDERNDKRASVKALVQWKLLAVDVDFGMCLKKDRWRISDVRVWNVSLLQNWRSQISDALRESTPVELMERLKKQIEEHKVG